MSKRVLLAVVLGVSLITVGMVIFAGNRKPAQVSVEPTLSRDSQVAITKYGFVPHTLSIKKGTKVTWVNLDTTPHRIASDPHPNHTALAGFDSKEPITAPNTYSFVFTKSGTFTYHDHVDPTRTGNIVVE